MSDLTPPPLPKWKAAVAARKAAEEAAKTEKEEVKRDEFSQDAPDVEEVTELHLSPIEQEIDEKIASIGVLEAYRRWIGKMVPKDTGRTEGIMISCPLPGHKDEDPSAWANTESNLWFCGGCEQGGDIWDLAAIHYGYTVPGYKSATEFRELRVRIAEELGYFTVKTATGKITAKAEVEEEEQVTEPLAEVIKLPSVVAAELSEEERKEEVAANQALFGHSIPWRDILPEGTFLRSWMEATTVDDCTEEYHFWNGMLAVGFAAGRRRKYLDREPVLANIFVCLTGSSGSGKSRSIRHLQRLLREVLPFKSDDFIGRGVKDVTGRGSGEDLVDAFVNEVEDPSDASRRIPSPVTGLIKYGELADLATRSARRGSIIQQTLMDFFDGSESITASSRSSGTKTATFPFAQTITTTQTRSLRHLLTEKEDVSGFLNRWIFAGGPPKKRSWRGGAIVDLSEPIKEYDDLARWAATDHWISWEEGTEATRIGDEFYEKKILVFKEALEKEESDILQRLDLLYKKLYLLFTLNEKETTITSSAVRSATALFDYIIRSYAAVRGQLSLNDTDENARKVLEYIERYAKTQGKGPKKRDIQRALTKVLTGDQIIKSLEQLEKLELVITEAVKPAKGPATVRYVVA